MAVVLDPSGHLHDLDLCPGPTQQPRTKAGVRETANMHICILYSICPILDRCTISRQRRTYIFQSVEIFNSRESGRVSVRVLGVGERSGACFSLSASVSMASVTAARWWQACREARGPSVASMCYTTSSLSMLLHLAHCPILLLWRPSGFHQGRGTTSQPFQLLFYYYIYIRTAGVLGWQSYCVMYPVLMQVAHCSSVSLWGSACCLLLLSRHSDLPLDALVHRCYRPGALLLLWSVTSCRALRSLIVTTKQIQKVQNWAFIFIYHRQQRSHSNEDFWRENRKVCKAPTRRANGKCCSKWARLLSGVCGE